MKRVLSREDTEAMRSCEHVSRIITDATVRGRLKRWGYVEASPRSRKYRYMPYTLTAAGAEALRAHDANQEPRP